MDSSVTLLLLLMTLPIREKLQRRTIHFFLDLSYEKMYHCLNGIAFHIGKLSSADGSRGNKALISTSINLSMVFIRKNEELLVLNEVNDFFC